MEIEDWNGHRVLAIPASSTTGLDPVEKAYADAAKSLAYDLGATPGLRLCWLCPMHQPDAGTTFYQCAHPRGLGWTATTNAVEGGCVGQVIVAEKYIPLVRMRLEGGS